MWTVVDGDPVADAPRRLPAAGRAGTGTATTTPPTAPMAWIDGLDIPFQYATESQFFEFGRDADHRRRADHPGPLPLRAAVGPPRPAPGVGDRRRRPARRCWPTGGSTPTRALDRAARAGGRGLRRAPSSPATPRSASPTRPPAATCCPRSAPRCTASRRGAETAPRREVGSSVFQVFDGAGTVTRRRREPGRSTRGDLFVVPSWEPFSVRSEAGATDSDSGALDLFRFCDAPIFEALAPATASSVDQRGRPDEARHHPHRRTAPAPSASTATRLVDLGAADVGALLADPDWRGARRSGRPARRHERRGRGLRPGRAAPGKIVCVGLNYRNHILEMGRDLPEYPTLFAKFADALIGANDDIVLPAETDAVDWEAELARRHRRAGAPRRRRRGGGRDRRLHRAQRRHHAATGSSAPREWLQGKTCEATTPVGPVPRHPRRAARRRPAGARRSAPTVDGETVQKDNTGDLLFDPVALVAVRLHDRHASTRATSSPPARPAASATPASRRVYLLGGETVVTEIEGIGGCTNNVVEDTLMTRTTFDDARRWAGPRAPSCSSTPWPGSTTPG